MSRSSSPDITTPAPGLAGALGTAVATRALVFAIGFIALLTLGPVGGPAPSAMAALATLPNHWDASWYLGVASGGYRWEPGESFSRLAFFPAFPLTLRAVAFVLWLPHEPVPWLWTGVLLSLTFFTLALWYLKRLTALHDPAAGNRAMLLAATYPFALFHGQIYPESLFLLAAVASLFFTHERRPWRAFAWGLTAGLTRPTGILVTLLLAPVCMRRARGATSASARLVWAVAAAGPLLGAAAYSGYVYYLTGSPLQWLHDQSGWGRVLRDPLSVIGSAVSEAIDVGPIDYAMAHPYDALNLSAFAAVLAAAVPVGRTLGGGRCSSLPSASSRRSELGACPRWGDTRRCSFRSSSGWRRDAGAAASCRS